MTTTTQLETNMKAITTEDDANTVYAEDKQVREWEQEQRNKILGSTSPSTKKQVLWRRVFPHPTYPQVIDEMVW